MLLLFWYNARVLQPMSSNLSSGIKNQHYLSLFIVIKLFCEVNGTYFMLYFQEKDSRNPTKVLSVHDSKPGSASSVSQTVKSLSGRNTPGEVPAKDDIYSSEKQGENHQKTSSDSGKDFIVASFGEEKQTNWCRSCWTYTNASNYSKLLKEPCLMFLVLGPGLPTFGLELCETHKDEFIMKNGSDTSQISVVRVDSTYIKDQITGRWLSKKISKPKGTEVDENLNFLDYDGSFIL